MKLSISRANASVNQLMADIEQLCQGHIVSKVPFDVRLTMDPQFFELDESSPSINDVFDVIDLIDVIKTHGMNDALNMLFNEDGALDHIIVRNEDGSYDDDTICLNLATSLVDGAIAGDTEGLIQRLIYGILKPFRGMQQQLDKKTDRTVELLAQMRQCYTDVLSKGEAKVHGLMNTLVVVPPKKIWQDTIKARIELGNALVTILRNGDFVDFDNAPISSALERIGRSYDDTTNSVRVTDKSFERTEDTLEALGISFREFVNIFKNGMQLLTIVIRVTHELQLLVRQMEANATKLKKHNRNDPDYTEKKAILRKNGTYIRALIEFYCANAFTVANSIYTIAKRATINS